MPLTSEEQALYDHAKGSLPRMLFQKDTAQQEQVNAFVKIFDAARQQIDAWISFTKLLEAVGMWLDQHARDRGTTRQGSETDAALRKRLRTIEELVTKSALIAAATNALTADGVSIPAGYPGFIELRKSRGFFRTDAGTTRKDSYMSRGYRMSSGRPSGIVTILPFGTTEATRKSVHEAIRQKKAGGVNHMTERRINP